MRLAAIDVGTNSVHLAVVDVGADGEITPIERLREQVELGRGAMHSRKLSEASMNRAVDVLRDFKRAIDALEVEAVEAVATSAVREARNGDAFVSRIWDASGIHVRVISGYDEARLLYLGALPDLNFAKGYPLLLDLGGGSLELVLCDASQMLADASLPLGHIRTAEAFLASDPPTEEQFDALRAHTREQLAGALNDFQLGLGGTLVGTGGSIRALGRAAALRRGDVEPQFDNGLLITQAELEDLLKEFGRTKKSRLATINGLDGRRATLPAATAVLLQTMSTLGFSELLTSDRSLRNGIVSSWIRDHQPEMALLRTEPYTQRRTVRSLMERYQVDVAHANHVRDLALALYNGLGEVDDDPATRALLEHAALLHDIGHHIHGRDHHKHGQYMILHSRMPGFTAHEVAVLANVVRYHRKAPKQSHYHFQSLSRKNQKKVELTSAVLSLADALDRSHRQTITELAVAATNGRFTITAKARGEALIEQYAAEVRSQRLSNVLRRPVTVVVETDRTG